MSEMPLHVVLAQAFIKKDSKFLMAQRSLEDDQAAGMWSIPGGKVDLETGHNVIENTLKREIREEVGIEIEDDLKYLGSQSFIRSSGHHVVSMTYLADWESGEAMPLEDQDEVKWCTIEEMEAIIHSENGPKYLEVYINDLEQ